ncbi:MAG: twin-arginine translocase TatA/TatE family subunit [Ilumatobacteraceae bacterium]
MDIGPPELILILLVVLVLFGGSQLPKLAKNLGKAQREFKAGLEDIQEMAHRDPAPAPDDSSAGID